MKGEMAYRDPSEDELRESVRKTIDLYAPAGNFALMGMIMYQDTERFIRTMNIISDEAVRYGTNYYTRG